MVASRIRDLAPAQPARCCGSIRCCRTCRTVSDNVLVTGFAPPVSVIVTSKRMFGARARRRGVTGRARAAAGVRRRGSRRRSRRRRNCTGTWRRRHRRRSCRRAPERAAPPETPLPGPPQRRVATQPRQTARSTEASSYHLLGSAPACRRYSAQVRYRRTLRSTGRAEAQSAAARFRWA